MSENRKSISQLETASDNSIDQYTLMEVAVRDTHATTGFSSYKKAIANVFDIIFNSVAFSRLKTTVKTIFGSINELSEDKNISAQFSTSATYAVGDYCIYEGQLYKCVTAVSTAGAWDSTKWSAVVVTDEMGSGSGGSSTLAGLSDVAISSLANRQMLKYNSTTGKWENFSLYIPEEFTVYEIDQTGDTYYINELFEVFNEPTKAIYLIKDPNSMPVWFQYVGTTVANSRWEVNYARVYKNNTTGRYNMELATLTENDDPSITDVVFSSTEFASYVELEMEAIAGMTFVIFRNAAITTNSTIEVFTDPPELQRTVPIQIENGACTVTFPALAQTTMIKVRIS